MGSHPIALPLLEYLFSQNSNQIVLSGIVTQPDRRSGRGQKVSPNSIAHWGARYSVPLFQPEKPGVETIEWMKEKGCDLILVMAYGHILGKAIRELPTQGIFNFHASLLPRFRGAAPIEAAIASGVSETGIALMEVIKEMDAGDVLDQEIVAIEDRDNLESIAQKLSFAAQTVLKRNLHALLNGTFTRTIQDLTQVTFCRKIEKDDVRLNFLRPAEELVFRIRALTPHPGCVIYINHEIYKIESYQWIGNVTCKPCQIFEYENQLCIGCGDRSAIVIERLQKPYGKMLPVEVFLNGNGDFLKYQRVENFDAMKPFEGKVFPF
jgi:methionyl-tRNA formyltransferase